MGWRCKLCKSDKFNIEYVERDIQATLDKNKNVVSCYHEIKEVDIYICDECGNSSDDLEDIAEWSEE